MTNINVILPEVLSIRINGVNEVVELRLVDFPQATIERFVAEGAGLILGNASLGSARVASGKGSWKTLTIDQMTTAMANWKDAVLPAMLSKMVSGTLGLRGDSTKAARAELKKIFGSDPTDAQVDQFIESPEYKARQEIKREARAMADQEAARTGITFLLSTKMGEGEGNGMTFEEAISFVAGHSNGYSAEMRTLVIKELEAKFKVGTPKGKNQG